MTNERMTKMVGLLVWMLAASTSFSQIIGIEDVVLPGAGFLHNMPFVSQGATFNNSYNSSFGSWGGFAASNHTDVVTPGFASQYSAYHLPVGGGDNSAQFAIGYLDAFTPTIPTIILPAETRPLSVQLTNNTYAALSMRDGDAFAKKFGGSTGDDPDYLFVTITGREFLYGPTTGSVDFFLADYRFANNNLDYIINAWTNVDLSGVGAASILEFTFVSSDVGPGGINTPTYFALDNLVVTPVPEPSSFVFVLIGWSFRRFNRHRVS